VARTSAFWAEIVFGGGNESGRVSRAVKKGQLRKIGPALYTSNHSDPTAKVVGRHVWEIVAHYAPGTVVSHRTAFAGRPSDDGTVFMTGSTGKRLDVAGLHLRVRKGPSALPGDQPFVGGLFLASEPRLLLENLSLSRARAQTRRTVPRQDVEARLETILRGRGEEGLNRIRDQARDLAPSLGARNEMTQLDAMIGALLRSGPANGLQTRSGRARAAGRPFDPERVERFDLLARTLSTATPVQRVDPVTDGPAFENLSFIDAYFSNYIEGTEFEIDEAHAIVFDGVIPARRPADAHDVLGTYRLVGSLTWLERTIAGDADAATFLDRLAGAHAILMAGRPEVGPGQWKTQPNRAGATQFVEPELVAGTLMKGWELARTLRMPLSRAAMIMFVLAEVHPFTDGNGRIARAFMNAELVAGGERRIIVPTVYRDDYLGALRVLSRQDIPMPFVLMLDQAQRFTAAVRWGDYAAALADLTAAKAFAVPEEGVRLLIPRTAR
jgi:Fic/DOC family